ncbi:MAG: hypothetical protein K6E40_18645 [Desulfovibrio sp.]|nr:hypothetical protein [Desulfovibrio sp.]
MPDAGPSRSLVCDRGEECINKDEVWIRAHLPDELAGEDIFLVRGDRLDDLT